MELSYLIICINKFGVHVRTAVESVLAATSFLNYDIISSSYICPFEEFIKLIYG